MFKRPKIRGTDNYGTGHFGAKRSKTVNGKKISYSHTGIDPEYDVDEKVFSHVSGIVTKLGYPYASHLEYRYVEIRDQNGFYHRFFYVEPSVKKGDRIFIGDSIGKHQDLGKLYKGITEHVHYEVLKYENGEKVFFDPNNFLEGNE